MKCRHGVRESDGQEGFRGISVRRSVAEVIHGGSDPEGVWWAILGEGRGVTAQPHEIFVKLDYSL
jgi:hypothetical protein